MKFGKLKKLNWYKILIVLILAIGIFLRVYGIAKAPIGLNQDETSIGYEAYAIVNYGIDRNGQEWPVHLISWGSGQNAFYAYIIMPFVKIFGPTTKAIRLPMAIIGGISLIVVFFILRQLKIKEEVKLLILLIFAVMPWHVMKSRWGLESNIFPDLILYVVALILLAVRRKKFWPMAISAVILGLSTYAYGTSYVFVPVFMMTIIGILIFRKEIKIWQGIVYMAITSLVALPMVIFVVINYFDLEPVKLLGFTIPRLDFNRFTEITSTNGNFIKNCAKNLLESIRLFWQQSDGLSHNHFGNFGLMYMFTPIFAVYGMALAFTKKYRKSLLVNLSIAFLFAALVTAILVVPNINRVNSLWIPCFALAGLGIYEAVKEAAIFRRVLTLVYVICAMCFTVEYFTSYQQQIAPAMRVGLIDAVKSLGGYDELYMSESIGQPYIYYLLYTEMDPNEYLAKRKIEEKSVMFQKVTEIGNVKFYLPERLESGNVYIGGLGEFEEIETKDCKREVHRAYEVVNCKEI